MERDLPEQAKEGKRSPELLAVLLCALPLLAGTRVYVYTLLDTLQALVSAGPPTGQASKQRREVE